MSQNEFIAFAEFRRVGAATPRDALNIPLLPPPAPRSRVANSPAGRGGARCEDAHANRTAWRRDAPRRRSQAASPGTSPCRPAAAALGLSGLSACSFRCG